MEVDDEFKVSVLVDSVGLLQLVAVSLLVKLYLIVVLFPAEYMSYLSSSLRKRLIRI